MTAPHSHILPDVSVRPTPSCGLPVRRRGSDTGAGTSGADFGGVGRDYEQRGCT